MSRSDNLPVIQGNGQRSKSNENRQRLRLVVHGFRVALLVSILLLIRFAHHNVELVESNLDSNGCALQFAYEAFPTATAIQPVGTAGEGNRVVDGNGNSVGYLMQTSPQSDHVIGYSGPTNCLIAMNEDHQIVSVRCLSSGDTIDHFEIVRDDQKFLDSFKGLGFESPDQWEQIDTVSGATLTSHAVIGAIANRIGGKAPSLKFQATPLSDNVASLFENLGKNVPVIEPTDREAVWDVLVDTNQRIGQVLITTPAADDLNGYQGPTAVLAGFDLGGKCIGLIVDQTYDNQPYANYLNDDAYFQSLYRGKTLSQIAGMTPEAAEIDGVSGATMTSICVVEGLAIAASEAIRSGVGSDPAFAGRSKRTRRWQSYLIDGTTVLLTLFGVAFSFTSLSKRKWFRYGYQVTVVIVLGFVSGHMLSQASVAGWSAHAIPWSVAPGLVFLSMAALLVPIVSKQQPYCQHICPFGAMQQMARNRVMWRLPIPSIVHQLRNVIPFVLLAVTVSVATTGFEFNLASIEPFDGFSFRVAGWATISILIVGLLLSLVSPMAYCRFGCPTGAMLNYVRFRSDSHRLGIRDAAAVVLLLIAIVLL